MGTFSRVDLQKDGNAFYESKKDNLKWNYHQADGWIVVPLSIMGNEAKGTTITGNTFFSLTKVNV